MLLLLLLVYLTPPHVPHEMEKEIIHLSHKVDIIIKGNDIGRVLNTVPAHSGFTFYLLLLLLYKALIFIKIGYFKI